MKVIEKFHLSRQYTPKNFLDTYRSSMELELTQLQHAGIQPVQAGTDYLPGGGLSAHGTAGFRHRQTEKRDPHRVSAQDFLRALRYGPEGFPGLCGN